MFYVTTTSGDTRYCETRKAAATAASCSVGRIGEIAKSGQTTTTLRNGAIVTIAKAAPTTKPAKKSTYWMSDDKAPKAEAQKVVDLIKRQSMLNYRGLFKEDPEAACYEGFKDYFGAATQTAFAQQVLWMF